MRRDDHVADRQAREILERAAEIDRATADSVSIETLRSAAREAGITEASFEAALMEQSRAATRADVGEVRRRRVMLSLAVAGASGLVLLGLTMLTRLFP